MRGLSTSAAWSGFCVLACCVGNAPSSGLEGFHAAPVYPHSSPNTVLRAAAAFLQQRLLFTLEASSYTGWGQGQEESGHRPGRSTGTGKSSKKENTIVTVLLSFLNRSSTASINTMKTVTRGKGEGWVEKGNGEKIRRKLKSGGLCTNAIPGIWFCVLCLALMAPRLRRLGVRTSAP